MRVLFAVSMQSSHFYPMVPLAWAMRADGHEVRVAHPPALTAPVVSSGLTSVPVGRDPVMTDEMRSRLPGRRNGERGPGAAPDQTHNIAQNLGFFRGVADLMAEDLDAVLATWRPDLVVFDWQCYAAAALARRAGIRAARFLFGPDFAAGAPGWRELEIAILDELLTRTGTGPDALDGDLCIDVCPPLTQFDTAPPAVRSRYIAYNGSGGVDGWTPPRRGRRRLAVTLGGTYSWVTGNLSPIEAVVAALDGADVDLVVAVPGHSRDLAPAPSERVAVVTDVPLALILGDCDAILHHGGDGTVATSLLAGVPQIVAPSAFVGFASYHSAERLTAAGTGTALDVEDVGDGRIRAVVEHVLDDGRMVEAARELRDRELARPSPVDAARTLTGTS